MVLGSLRRQKPFSFVTSDKARTVYQIKNLLVEMAIHLVPNISLH